MKIEQTGDYLVIKDNYNEVQHITPYKGIFVHKHPVDSNFILISDRSKKSVKDAIRIRVSDVNKVGERYVYNPSRAILLIYISMLLDPSKSILLTQNSVDGHLLEEAQSQTYYIDVEELLEEPRHYFNAYDTSNVVFELEALPDDSLTFRITNGGLWGLFLRDANKEPIISYTGNTGSQQQIGVGKTVEVAFDVDTGIYTITDL